MRRQQQPVGADGLWRCGRKAFQVLVCVPAGKSVLDLVDETDQDSGGLAQVFQTAPTSTRRVCPPPRESGEGEAFLRKHERIV